MVVVRRHVCVAVVALLALVFARPVVAADKCEWTGIDRVVAIGDVHGAYDRFVEILKAAGVIDAGLHWAAGTTHVVQLGDIVDRGDDSRKALDLVRRLDREAEAAKGHLHLLLGNHEVARMLGDLRLTAPGEYTAFVTADSESVREKFVKSLKAATDEERAQLVQELPLGSLEMRQAFGRDGEYGHWLRDHPAVVKIDQLMFVHGGISPAVAPMGCAAINEQVHRDLTSDLDKTLEAPLATLTARIDGPLWYRGLAQEPDTFAAQLDDILARASARAIVVGHTVTPTGRITTRFGGRVVQIDTGMQPAYAQGGRASALEIVRGEATAIYVDRRDPVALAKPRVSEPAAPSAHARP
jgi:calcineurin-like phosphoesterase family protein